MCYNVTHRKEFKHRNINQGVCPIGCEEEMAKYTGTINEHEYFEAEAKDSTDRKW